MSPSAKPFRERIARLGEAPGGTTPQRRLAVTPADTVRKLSSATADVSDRLRGATRSGFPLRAPTRPGTVPPAPLKSRTGTNYPTEWARRYPARVARLLLTEGLTRPLINAIAPPTVEGLDRISALEGPAIFAANHTSHVDTPLLLATIPEKWRNRLVVAGAADYFFDNRAKAAFFALSLNAVPIERTRVDRSSARNLSRLLDQGWSLLIFPEGGRSPDGWGQPHRAGAAWLAARTGRPVVPVHVAGTGTILPRGSNRIHPGKTVVTFGRPLRVGPEDARGAAEKVKAAVARLADEQSGDFWSAAKNAARGNTPKLTGPEAASAWRRAWTLDAPKADKQPRWPKN